jgi:hypothetical protein
MLCPELGENLGLEGRQHFRRFGCVQVDLGGHIDGALTVDSFDGGVTLAQLRLGDLTEGHSDTLRSAYPHLLEIALGNTFIRRVTNHYFDFVAPALDALRLFTVKCLAHLPGEILERQSECFSGRLDVQLDLLLARLERVSDVVYPGVFREAGLEVVRDRLQFGCVGTCY